MTPTKFIEHVRNWDVVNTKVGLTSDATLAQFVDRSGRTALHHCAGRKAEQVRKPQSHAMETAKVLLEAGADNDAIKTMSEGSEIFEARPVWYSVARGENFELTKFFLEQGANPNGCLWASCFREDIATTRLLLEYGSEVEAVFHGDTPFMFSVRHRKFKCLATLVEAGANVDYQDPKGNTALSYAVLKKFDLSSIRQLVSLGASPQIANNTGLSAISTAATMRDKSYELTLRSVAE